MAEHHNHTTRDIKPLGVCPACDYYHNRAAAAEVNYGLSDSEEKATINSTNYEPPSDRITSSSSFAGGWYSRCQGCGLESGPWSTRTEADLSGQLHEAYHHGKIRARALLEAADLIDKMAKKDGVLGPDEESLDASILRNRAARSEGTAE